MAEITCQSCSRGNPSGSRYCRGCGLLLGAAAMTVVLDLSEFRATAAIGSYEIVGEVGKGGMGTVYRARHRTKGWDVALKVMRAEFADDPSFVRRFLREAKHLSGIDHPNLPRIYEYGKAPDGREFLAMEFIHGRSLIAYQDQSFEKLYPILCQICDGVTAIHAKDIVHRDLSPDNILVIDGAPPIVKIIDFGIAKSADSSTGALNRAKTFVGKLEYCSPEQLGQLPEGEEVDARSDIYTLGIIMFQLFTGTLPFRAPTPMGLVRAQLTQQPPDIEAVAPGRIPPGLAEIVRGCLEKDRSDRIATALELKTLLQGVDARLRSHSEEKIVEVGGELRPAPFWRWRWVAAGLAAFLLGGLLAVCFHRGPAARPPDGGTSPPAVIGGD